MARRIFILDTGCLILYICNLLYEDLATATIIPKLIDEIVMRIRDFYSYLKKNRDVAGYVPILYLFWFQSF